MAGASKQQAKPEAKTEAAAPAKRRRPTADELVALT
jgi:hypothetical protein